MKVILNVSKSSQYAIFNGLTFEVKDIMKQSLGLIGVNREFPENQTDFSLSEVIVVDLEKELKTNDGVKKRTLLNYVEINKINIRGFKN